MRKEEIMKTKLTIATFLLLVFVNTAFAQVDNCCFVNRQCNTDSEWKDGYWAYHRNECPRGASAGQASASPPANGDNCCFVNRHCTTDAEWTDGYWAYQNNQCGAPGGGGQSASPAPIASAATLWTPNMTAAVKALLADPSSDFFNNCCYMYLMPCHSQADWNQGYWQYQNHQCAHPSPVSEMPVIVGNNSPSGTAKFHNLVNTALEWLRIHAPAWLEYIRLSGVREWKLLPAGVGGGFFNTTWIVGHGFWGWQESDPNWQPDPDYIAGYVGGIVHEACHAIQQRTFSQTVDWANELPCVEAQLAAIHAVKPDSKDISILSNLVGHPNSWRR